MSDREASVLLGVSMPEPGVLTAGQRWTAALAVLLAALLLVSNHESGRTLLPAPTSVGTPTANAAPPPTSWAPAAPVAPSAAPVLPTAPSSPSLDLDTPAPAPEPSPAPEPTPPTGDDGSPPPNDDDESAPCPVPVPAVLAGADLCPPT